MKHIFYILAFVMFLQRTNAQFSKNIFNMVTVDSGTIRVLYALNATDMNDPKTYFDLQRLELGINSSKYYSYFVYNSDSLSTEWRKKRPNAQSAPVIMGLLEGQNNDWNEYRWSEYFKDFSKNLLSEYTRVPHGSIPNFYYSENIPTQEWELHEDTLTIAGYLCQKATCRFRGRDYIAWFTVDIPINNGPWKFGGLPGLILKVYDNDKLYTFECVAVEHHEKKYPVKKYNTENYAKMDRKKFLIHQKNINEDPLKTTGWVPVNGGKLPPRKTHHPLELE
jgi:GLPGLI family protein